MTDTARNRQRRLMQNGGVCDNTDLVCAGEGEGQFGTERNQLLVRIGSLHNGRISCRFEA